MVSTAKPSTHRRQHGAARQRQRRWRWRCRPAMPRRRTLGSVRSAEKPPEGAPGGPAGGCCQCISCRGVRHAQTHSAPQFSARHNYKLCVGWSRVTPVVQQLHCFCVWSKNIDPFSKCTFCTSRSHIIASLLFHFFLYIIDQTSTELKPRDCRGEAESCASKCRRGHRNTVPLGSRTGPVSAALPLLRNVLEVQGVLGARIRNQGPQWGAPAALPRFGVWQRERETRRPP